VVAVGAETAACLVGWERPGPERLFEALWTVEREVVLEAARACCTVAAEHAPEPAQRLAGRLASLPSAPGPGEVRRAVTLTNRMIAYLAA
jgi:DICT domain-containing protein